MIPLLAPSGGIAKNEEADFLMGGLKVKLLAAGGSVDSEKTTGMDVYTSIRDQLPARCDRARNDQDVSASW
jgi:hypothetical protein